MERVYTASTKAAFGLLILLFAWSVYRAATRDVAPAEAWNYDRYVSASWSDTLSHWDTNSHILNTLAIRIATSALGRKEIAIRLPSLLAGLLYFWAVWRLCNRLYRGWLFPLALALMVLNPIVVDALSESRGYGMGIASWCWALEHLLVYFDHLKRRNLNICGICLALSVAACATFIVPALGLSVAATALIRRAALRELWLPMLLFLFVLLAIPLNRVLLSDFAQGASSLRQTLADLTIYATGSNAKWLAFLVRIGLGLILLYALFLVVQRRRSNRILDLTALSALCGLLVLSIAHAWIKAPFPQRGAIYFVPLLTLLVLAVFRPLPRLVTAGGLVALAIYLANFPAGAYLDGREFTGSREAAKALRTDAGPRPVTVAASPKLEPIVNYYRTRYRQGNWSRVEHRTPGPGADYYFLTPADAHLIPELRLRTVYRTPGLILAAR